MKKVVAILVALVMVLCLGACGNDSGNADKESVYFVFELVHLV